MTSRIFVNLPVRDLKRSMAFFENLGFGFDPRFTDDTAACMVIGGGNYVMLLTHAKFGQFCKKDIADTRHAAEMLLAVSFDSRAQVDEITSAALAGGATEPHSPRDYGFMYQRSFEDLDGHIWEAFHMDESAIAS